MSAPFFAVESGRWPRVLARLRLLGALEEDEVRTDLRYLENEARVWLATEGKRGTAFPGRRALESRWGWPERRVRAILAADDWHDEHNPVSRADLYGKRPGVPVPAPQTSPCASPCASPSHNGPTPEVGKDCPAPVPVPAPQTSPCASPTRAGVFLNHDQPPNHDPISAPATAVAPPATPKAAKPIKPKADPHPFHNAVIDAWCSTYRNVTGNFYGAEDKHRPDNREIGMLTRLRDDRVSRDPAKGPRDVEALRDAFRRFMQRGPFVRPAGPSTVRAFCADPAGWFSSTEGPAARGGRGRAFDSTAEALRLLDPDHEPARQQSDALDVTFTEVA